MICQDSVNTQPCSDESKVQENQPQVVRMEDLVEGQGKHGPRPEGWLKRFWRMVNKKGDNECWEWIGGKSITGYGKLKIGRLGIDRKSWDAHRLSYLIDHGTLPKNLLICHKCDNPSCVNPNHLFAGTAVDNRRDSINKNRGTRGEKHPNSKLNDAQVNEIRSMFSAGGITQHQLAIEFNTTQGVISQFIRNVRRA